MNGTPGALLPTLRVRDIKEEEEEQIEWKDKEEYSGVLPLENGLAVAHMNS